MSTPEIATSSASDEINGVEAAGEPDSALAIAEGGERESKAAMTTVTENPATSTATGDLETSSASVPGDQISKSFEFESVAEATMCAIRSSLAEGSKRIQRSEKKRTIKVKGIAVEVSSAVKLGNSLFFAAMAVLVDGRKGALMTTYANKKITKGATYGIVTFADGTTESRIMKGDKTGQIRPVLPYEMMSSDLYNSLQQRHTNEQVERVICRTHSDRLNSEVDTSNTTRGSRRRKPVDRFSSYYEADPKKKRVESTPSDSEATEDEFEVLSYYFWKYLFMSILQVNVIFSIGVLDL